MLASSELASISIGGEGMMATSFVVAIAGAGENGYTIAVVAFVGLLRVGFA